MGEVCQVCQSSYFGRQHVNAHPAFKILPGCTCHAHKFNSNDLDGEKRSPESPSNLPTAAGELANAVVNAAKEVGDKFANGVNSLTKSTKKYLGMRGEPTDSYIGTTQQSEESEQSEQSEQSGPNDTADNSEYDS